MRCFVWLGLLSFVIGSAGGLNAAEPEATFLAGFAERDITPEIGMEQPGGYGKAFHRTLHDPCKARAAVFGDGKTRVAIVSIDALMIRRPTVLKIRENVEKACGIPGHAVLLHATHSHSSGPLGMILPGEYDGGSDLVKKLAYEDSSCANADYLVMAEKQITDAIIEADAKKAALKCSAGSGIEDQVAFNRRFRMKNGLTFTHPRPGNPDIIEPAGPTDPQVGVVGAWDEKGKLVGCIVNYSCHATTSPGGISASYIQYLEHVIRGVFGDDVVVVYLNGASGDVTQVDNLTKYVTPKPEQWSRLVGGSIGAEAVKVLLRSEPGILLPIAYDSKTWKIPRRKPAPERVAQCEKIATAPKNQTDATTWTFAKEIVLLNYLCQSKPEVDVEVQAIQVGPVVMLTDPAEYFVEYGLKIKEASPFPLTFPVSLANGCVGYVPTEEAFSERGGGYETRLSSYSNLEITAGTQMMNAAIELAKKLTPGKIPTRALNPPYSGGAWNYGNLPPELT